MTPKSPFQDWLAVQEHKRDHRVFILEWFAVYAIAYLFWSVMFIAAPGTISPGLAATLVSFLYATCIIYGRLLRATGCPKCHTPLPFVRKEVGRRHLRDEEHCVEIQYGAEEFGQVMIQVYSKVTRSDMVSYSCHHCHKLWEERHELAGSGYRLVSRTDETK